MVRPRMVAAWSFYFRAGGAGGVGAAACVGQGRSLAGGRFGGGSRMGGARFAGGGRFGGFSHSGGGAKWCGMEVADTVVVAVGDARNLSIPWRSRIWRL